MRKPRASTQRETLHCCSWKHCHQTNVTGVCVCIYTWDNITTQHSKGNRHIPAHELNASLSPSFSCSALHQSTVSDVGNHFQGNMPIQIHIPAVLSHTQYTLAYCEWKQRLKKTCTTATSTVYREGSDRFKHELWPHWVRWHVTGEVGACRYSKQKPLSSLWEYESAQLLMLGPLERQAHFSPSGAF